MIARGRQRASGMNQLESAYAGILRDRQLAGEVIWWAYEGVKFRLADKTFYTPDFAVMLAGGEIEMHEVKGHWEDDARVKIKVAAEMFPLRFLAVRRFRKMWVTEEL
jgi:hypothetical protein